MIKNAVIRYLRRIYNGSLDNPNGGTGTVVSFKDNL